MFGRGALGNRFPAYIRILLFAGLLSTCGISLAAPDAPKQPAFVFLYARITDHINVDLSEDRLRHLLPLIEKFRNEHPSAHVVATVLFSGASSDALAKRDSQTHIVDFVKEYVRRGVVEVGYDGENEPTYKNRPTLDFSNAKSIDDRWMVRAQTEDRILTEARDPLTGTLQPGGSGGLKRMQEVFGEAAYIAGVEPMLDNGAVYTPKGGVGATTTGGTLSNGPKLPQPTFVPEIGGDSEALREIQKYNKTAVMVGLHEDNPAQIAGFGGSEDGFLKIMGASVETSPEVYWEDNALRLSEVSNTSEAAAEAAHEFKGVTRDDLQDDLGELNRSRVQVVRVELADERYYLQQKYTKDDHYPLQYAYDHPDNPKLSREQEKDKSDIGAAYAREEAAVEWLAAQFFAANPGSRFVASSELKQMAAPATGYAISIEELRAGTKEAFAQWGINTFPPDYVTAGGHYLSLADWFQVMTDALAAFDRTGKLPESVEVVPVYGPKYTPTGHGPNVGEATVAAVAHAAAGIADRLHDASTGTVPKNCIPAVVTIASPGAVAGVGASEANGTINVSAAQFLRLMAAALATTTPETKLQVRMSYMSPDHSMLIPKTRTQGEMGAMWTVKPAQLRIGEGSQSAQAQK